ncbi:MAG: site-2 protease family protein [Planctomycetaceae bacterium]|nr:site-2 protease family protein [Planctomycetaceae bacterium]
MDTFPAQFAVPPDAPAEQAPPVRKRRIALPLTLFVLTGLSTLYTGAVHSEIAADGQLVPVVDWGTGLTYMLCVMSILLAHEMGHFLQALYHRIPASLPYFIPMPLMPLGTMGAVIGMQGSQADRKQLFDIGITGPIAGLVVALPIAWHGIAVAQPYAGDVPPMLVMHDPYIFTLMARHLHPQWPADQVVAANPYYLAGWLGVLITGLNMLPVSQLDGGHTAYALFGRRAHLLARGIVLSALGAILWAGQTQWVVMLCVLFIIGVDHPPTRNDLAPLGFTRRIIGLIALLIPLFCLAAVPISVAGE